MTISRVGPMGAAGPATAAVRFDARSQEEGDVNLAQLLAADHERGRLFLKILVGDQGVIPFLAGGAQGRRRRRPRRRPERGPRDPELEALREGEQL
ncbi:MAG TPA: hypothetical protein VKZ18_24835 [Polyangia bacterium]|nr:hypothetical protein [Polyangia bacterium]